MTTRKAKPVKPALKEVPKAGTQEVEMLAYPPQFIQMVVNAFGKFTSVPQGMCIDDVAEIRGILANKGHTVTVAVEVTKE